MSVAAAAQNVSCGNCSAVVQNTTAAVHSFLNLVVSESCHRSNTLCQQTAADTDMRSCCHAPFVHHHVAHIMACVEYSTVMISKKVQSVCTHSSHTLFCSLAVDEVLLPEPAVLMLQLLGGWLRQRLCDMLCGAGDPVPRAAAAAAAVGAGQLSATTSSRSRRMWRRLSVLCHRHQPSSAAGCSTDASIPPGAPSRTFMQADMFCLFAIHLCHL